jgi:serine/threonine protein kinase
MATGPLLKAPWLPQIGRYQPVSRVATGGMGAVYKAVDLESGENVALKVLSPEWTSKPVLLRRFELEAMHGRQLGKHPHVVGFVEAGESGGFHFLALEFVEGIDLKEYITAQTQLDVGEAQEIITQAARAIAHLHEHGITHRDIKPSNFLVSHREGRPYVKLIDLGLARNSEDDEECRVTRPGTTLGTVDYIAPEQARDSGSADVRSDIYALGCTWFHMLAGQPPFPEGNITERILQHIEAEPPDIRALNPAVPEAMADILKRMLAKNPADRYQTPAALLRDLEVKKPASRLSKDLLAGLAVGEKTPAQAKPIRPRRRSTGSSQTLRVFQDESPRSVEGKKEPRRRARLGWWVSPTVAGAVFLLGVVVLGVALRRSPQTPTLDEPLPGGPAFVAPPVEALGPAEPAPAVSKQPPPPPVSSSPKIPTPTPPSGEVPGTFWHRS